MQSRSISDVVQIRSVLTDPTWLVKSPGEAVPGHLRGSRAGEVLAAFARWSDGESHPPRKQLAIDLIGRMSSDMIPVAAREAISGLISPVPEDVQFLAPGAIVAHLLGVPASHRVPLVQQVRALILAARPGASPDECNRAIAAIDHAWTTILDISGTDDIEVNASFVSMIFQASDAMAAMVGNALVALAAETNLRDSSGAQCVLTSMRERVPVRNTTRIRDGEQVIIDLESAHRQHPDAAWTFGFGHHACPGRNLTVAIAAAVIDAVTELQPFDPQSVRQTGWQNLPNVWIPNLVIQEVSAP